jgi:dynein heavy chain 2
MEQIKDLHSRAQGEVSIREALQELDVWGASVVFALTDYKDCRGGNVKLIKDWKDLTNKV